LSTGRSALESECQRAIDAAGLESSVGFLHETSGYQTKQSLVYDLQEPFRWLADVAVMEAFDSRVLDLPNFYFTGDDYMYRFEPDAKHRFIQVLRGQFNSGVSYKGCVLKWDTVIEQKATELGRFLVGRSREIEFTEPSPILMRFDALDIRKRILTLTQEHAAKLGIEKSTLHYLRKHALGERSFRLNRKVKEKIANL